MITIVYTNHMVSVSSTQTKSLVYMSNLTVVFKYHTIHQIIVFLGLFDFMTSLEEDR
jgi:hypothetical protein